MNLTEEEPRRDDRERDPRLDDLGLQTPVVSRERERGGEGRGATVYPVLHEQQVLEALHDLPEWTYRRDRLERRLRFGDEAQVTLFLAWLEAEASDMACRPEVRQRGCVVELALTTHAAGERVTACDVEMAAAIDERLAGA